MAIMKSDPPLHKGHVLPAQTYSVFADPGEEIGQLNSYCSNLPANYRRKLSAFVFSACGLCGTTAFMSLGFLTVFGLPFWLAVSVSTLVGIGTLWPLWKYGENPHYCTFVGNDGVAKFTCRNGNTKILTKHLLRFEDAHSLTTRILRHHVNGIYTGTIYLFCWYNKTGQPVFRLKAEAKDCANASIDSEVPFLLAAEKQWNMHITEPKLREMNEEGFVTFTVHDSTQELRLGATWIEIESDDGCYRFESHDVQMIEVTAGRLIISAMNEKTKDLVLTIDYGSISNASFFLTLARANLDIKVSDDV